MSKAVKKAAIILVLISILSKALGILREVLFARQFGTSGELDAFVGGTVVVNTLIMLLTGGVFVPALISLLVDTRERNGQEEERSFLMAISTYLSVLTIVLSIFSFFGSTLIVKIVAPGLPSEYIGLAANVNRITTLGLLFFVLGSISRAILNSHDRFTLSGFQDFALNVGVVGGLLCTIPFFGDSVRSIYIVSVGTAVGAGLRLFIQLPHLVPVLVKDKIWPGFRDAFRFDHFRSFLVVLLPLMVATAIPQIGIAVDRSIASTLGQGSMSALNFADRLCEFSKSIVGFSLGTAILPSLSRFLSSGDSKKFNSLVRKSVQMMVFLGVPLFWIFVLYSGPLVSLFFERGMFGLESVGLTARALIGHAIGAAIGPALFILLNVFYAKRSARPIFIVHVFALIVKVVSELILSAHLGVTGIALANSIFVIICVVGFFYFAEQMERGSILTWKMIKDISMTTLTLSVSFLVGLMIYLWLPRFVPSDVKRMVLSLAVTGVLALVVAIVARLESFISIWNLARERLKFLPKI